MKTYYYVTANDPRFSQYIKFFQTHHLSFDVKGDKLCVEIPKGPLLTAAAMMFNITAL